MLIEQWCTFRILEDDTLKLISTYYSLEEAINELRAYPRDTLRIIQMWDVSR